MILELLIIIFTFLIYIYLKEKILSKHKKKWFPPSIGKRVKVVDGINIHIQNILLSNNEIQFSLGISMLRQYLKTKKFRDVITARNFFNEITFEEDEDIFFKKGIVKYLICEDTEETIKYLNFLISETDSLSEYEFFLRGYFYKENGKFKQSFNDFIESYKFNGTFVKNGLLQDILNSNEFSNDAIPDREKLLNSIDLKEEKIELPKFFWEKDNSFKYSSELFILSKEDEKSLAYFLAKEIPLKECFKIGIELNRRLKDLIGSYGHRTSINQFEEIKERIQTIERRKLYLFNEINKQRRIFNAGEKKKFIRIFTMETLEKFQRNLNLDEI